MNRAMIVALRCGLMVVDSLLRGCGRACAAPRLLAARGMECRLAKDCVIEGCRRRWIGGFVLAQIPQRQIPQGALFRHFSDVRFFWILMTYVKSDDTIRFPTIFRFRLTDSEVCTIENH